jgi:hypothetical protein
VGRVAATAAKPARKIRRCEVQFVEERSDRPSLLDHAEVLASDVLDQCQLDRSTSSSRPFRLRLALARIFSRCPPWTDWLERLSASKEHRMAYPSDRNNVIRNHS